MARTWTQEQAKVIELHNRNILVSAAAGSGKTAALVERIIRMITDPDKDIDIDRLVVVTFTKAAAGEMKHRISEAIEKLIAKDSDNVKLQRQLTLVNNASITTIDSFCLNIVRNNFTNADIDPGFRTADEGELKLLQSEVIAKIMEEYYAGNNQDFFDLIDAYGSTKNDDAIIDVIYKIYNYSRSYPWPQEWLDECRRAYKINNIDELNQNPAVSYITLHVRKILEDYRNIYSRLEQICMESDGPAMYKPMIASDKAQLEHVILQDNYEALRNAVANIQFDRMSSKKDESVSAEKKEYVKFQRDKYKKTITDLQKKVFRNSVDSSIADVLLNAPMLNILLDITQRFIEELSIAKKKKNIIDFNDMEHLALDILVHNNNGVLEYSDVADRLSEFYEEILIDEYQDSNLLQEQILYSISKGRISEADNNMFMVGDVKQSIYKFRLARPDLFIEKYNSYETTDSLFQKIELKMNFRSREVVLNSVNDIFFNIMKEYGGGIEYNENAMLNTGMTFAQPQEEYKERISKSTDILMIDVKNKSEDNLKDIDELEEEIIEREIEARAIGLKIKEIVDAATGLMIVDKQNKGYRKAEYRDIVILTRTVSGWADTIVNELMSMGIPAYSDTASGYFNTREIKLLLSYLAVIDNPIQDIPLAAVLTSYFGNISIEELSYIRSRNKKVKLYDAIKIYCEDAVFEDKGDNALLRDKIKSFLQQLDSYRKMSVYMDIHEIIWKIIYNTGYYDYIGTMPSAKKRQANLDMLIQKARAYENTSYTGLFNFLKYIDKLQKYEVDNGEASVFGENENLVRIMSIHKSKGLEFPIVILAGMGKKFNNMDANSNVIVDSDLGIGAYAVNLENRTKSSTIIRNAMSIKLKMDNLFEELRVLYVALTRAKEKLIMAGTVKNIEKSYSQWEVMSKGLSEREASYSYEELISCSNYFDLVVPTGLAAGNSGHFICEIQNAGDIINNSKKYIDEFTINPIENDLKDDLESMDKDNTSKEVLIDYKYPYAYVTKMKAKMTVSELKKKQDYNTEEVKEEYEDSLKNLSQVSGSDRGMAYHRVMEFLDYRCVYSKDSIKEYIDNLVQQEKITQQQADMVSIDKIYNFCQSDIGKRVAGSFGNSLRREQQFVYGIPPQKVNCYKEIMEGKPEIKDQMILIQGIIDLYFIEDNEAVIVDYKTDRLEQVQNARDILIERYKVQLEYYAAAIEQLTGLRVKEKIIYSFGLEEAIEL